MLHIHACCKHIFQVFSGVSYVCLQVFYVNVAYVCNVFYTFSQVFQTLVSNVLCLLLYVATVISGCFKSRSGAAHGIRVGSSWRHG
jgi:hypothetical protein